MSGSEGPGRGQSCPDPASGSYSEGKSPGTIAVREGVKGWGINSVAELIEGGSADVEGGDQWSEGVLVDVVDEGGVGGRIGGVDLNHDLVAVGRDGGTIRGDGSCRGHV